VLLLPAAERRLPLAAVGLRLEAAPALDDLDELLDDQPAVAHDRDVGPPDLAQLGGVDVDVDDLGVGGEAVELARHPVVEPAAEGDEQVRPLHGRDGRVVAVHAGHAQAQRVAVGEGTSGHERRDHGDVAGLGQLSQGLGGPGLEDATAGVDHRAASLGDEVGGLADHAGVAPGHRLVAGEVELVGPVPLQCRVRVLGVDDVLGDVDEHRPGPARRGDVERLADRAGDVGGVGDEEVVLGDRLGDAGGVALLEGVAADGGGRHLAGDAHHRDRVHEGVAERGDDVGGRRAAGDHGDARASGDVGIALRHVPGPLLVAHEDVADRRVDDRVVDRQDRPAGEPEHHLDALELERLDEGLAAVERFAVLGAVAVAGHERIRRVVGPKTATTSPVGRSRAHARGEEGVR
jgi:hypothetical protein